LGGICIIAILLMTWFIDPVFAMLTRVMLALLQTVGMQVAMPELQPDAFPFWDSTMLVLSIAAMVLMTRKYVENWLLWVIIDVISVVIYAVQGVYAMSLEYVLLTAIALMGSYSWIKSAQRNGYMPLAARAC
ncbi:nicotinamide riboside transporter PnuC, partial [Salmonella enterica subsp. enterica serovar Cerro]